jgi:hypothetical protein
VLSRANRRYLFDSADWAMYLSNHAAPQHEVHLLQWFVSSH